MASTERKFAEGMEYMRQADKCLKTSLFKWQPDFEGAAMDYTSAATCFKNAKAYPNCKECLIKAADSYRQQHSFFSAAKSLEQAALVSKDMGDLNGAMKLVERASQLFQEHGTPDTAALSLDKGAKMIEAKYPAEAARLYEKAADVVLLEDRPRQSAEFLGKSARLMVKLKRYDEAAELVKRELEMQEEGENRGAVGRLIVALVLIHLTRGDLIAAQKAFQGKHSYVEQEEVATIETLLTAFDEEDGELAARALNSPFLKHMDVEYAKLARNLTLPDSTISDSSGMRCKDLVDQSSKSSSTESASHIEKSSVSNDHSVENGDVKTSSSVPVGSNDDDEYSEGLC